MHLGVRQLRALAHPTRLRILSLLTGAPMTAADVARELSMTHANASYHLRQLAAAGTIEVAGEEHIRGGIAKRYRYVVEELGDKPPTGKPSGHVAERRALYAIMAGELTRRAQFMTDTVDGGLIADAELWVDPAIWDDVKTRVYKAAETLHRSARPPRTPGTTRVNATIALFPMEPQ